MADIELGKDNPPPDKTELNLNKAMLDALETYDDIKALVLTSADKVEKKRKELEKAFDELQLSNKSLQDQEMKVKDARAAISDYYLTIKINKDLERGLLANIPFPTTERLDREVY
jgi:hypothetical protein